MVLKDRVSIHNMRYTRPSMPYDFKVDRSTRLGNPYKMEGGRTREQSIAEYKSWFDKYGINSDYFKEIVAAYDQYGIVRLFCWCAPEACHAEIIKKALEEM